MSLIPAFEIGLCNAWIFMLLDVLTFPLFMRIAKGRAPEDEGKSQVSALSRTERITLYSSKIIYIPAFIYFEEQSCLEKYGDAYHEYMDRTPRYIGIPKSVGN